MQTTHPSTDQQLFDAYVRQKTDDAFRALVERHAPWVFAAAHRQLRDHQLAEDATQAVFILLIRRSPDMKSPHQLTAWLFNAVHYTVKNILRSRRRRQFHELRSALRQSPAPTAAAQNETDLADQLDAAVSTLSPHYRTAILLRFYQDLPFDQMAQSLNITEAAARKRTTRAVEMLRHRFVAKGATVSAGSLTAAVATGLHQSPAAFAQTISHAALAAKAGATLPASVAAVTKGAAYLMATAKLKTAVVLIAASLAVIVPATLVAVHYASRPQIPAAPPEPVTDFLDFYRPAPDEAVKLVENVTPEARAAMFQHVQDPTGKNQFFLPTVANTMILDWNNGNPQNVSISTGREIPRNEAIIGLASLVFGLKRDQIELPVDAPTDPVSVPGDLVYNSALPRETLIPALEKFYKERLNIPLKLVFTQSAQQPAYILSGNLKFHRIPFTETRQPPRIRGQIADPLIEVYPQDKFDPAQTEIGSGITQARLFSGMLTNWLKADVTFDGDATALPEFIGYRVYGSWEENPKHAAAILQHIADQTGLELKTVSAPTSHLRIEAASDPLADFDKYYRLKPGETFALVTDAPQSLRDAYVQQSLPPSRYRPKGQFVIVCWDGDKPHFWGFGDSVPLLDILGIYLNIYPQHLDMHLNLPPKNLLRYSRLDPTFAFPDIHADLVIRQGATPEQYRASLQTILSQTLHRPITLTFRDVQQKAIILRGKWLHADTQDVPANPKKIEIYGPRLDDNPDRGIIATGDSQYIANNIGSWLHQPLIIEAEGFPPTLTAHFNTLDRAPDKDAARDKSLVLNHLAEQTHLTWSEESRPIRHLFIEESTTAAAPTSNDYHDYYTLADNENIRIVTNAPLPARVALYKKTVGGQPDGSGGIILIGNPDRPRNYLFGGGRFGFQDVLQFAFHVFPQQIEGLDKINAAFPGDIVVRPGVAIDDCLPELEKILESNLNVHAKLNFRDVERRVTVLHGPGNLKPGDTPIINVYGVDSDLLDNTAATQQGSPDQFALTLGRWLNASEILIDNPPPLNRLQWKIYHPLHGKSRDASLVLPHILEQTGFTMTEETRTVHHLIIEPQK